MDISQVTLHPLNSEPQKRAAHTLHDIGATVLGVHLRHTTALIIFQLDAKVYGIDECGGVYSPRESRDADQSVEFILNLSITYPLDGEEVPGYDEAIDSLQIHRACSGIIPYPN